MKIGNIINFIIVFTIVFDMGGELGIRKIGFVLLVIALLFNLRNIKNIMFNITYAWLFAFFIIFPTSSLLFSLYNGADGTIGISQISVFYFSFMYFSKRIVDRGVESVDGMQHLNYSLISMAFFYIVMIVIFVIFPKLYFHVTDFIHAKGAGYAGIRNEGDIQLVNIYLKSSLFLIFTYSFYLKKNFFVSLLIFIGSIITTSKVLILSQLSLLIFKGKVKLSWLILFLAALPILIYVFYAELLIYIDYIYNTISGNSASFSTRAHHLADFSNLIGNNFSGFLFGFGPGSEFYSSNSGTYVSNIEIDHFNTIRKFGLLWFLTFLAIVLYNCFLLFTQNKLYIAIGLLFSFILAGTNPVLLSPVFFIILTECYIYSKQLNIRTFELTR